MQHVCASSECANRWPKMACFDFDHSVEELAASALDDEIMFDTFDAGY